MSSAESYKVTVVEFGPFMWQGNFYSKFNQQCAVFNSEKTEYNKKLFEMRQFYIKKVKIQTTHMKISSKLIIPNVIKM